MSFKTVAELDIDHSMVRRWVSGKRLKQKNFITLYNMVTTQQHLEQWLAQI
ncbi:hypothetical protein [Lysinibacillus fusiformis]